MAKTLGWSRAEILDLEESEFEAYLRLSLISLGADPDELDAETVAADGPPPDDAPLDPRVQALLERVK